MFHDLLGIALILVGLISAFARGRAIAQPHDPYAAAGPLNERE
jgi:hypothetical protein